MKKDSNLYKKKSPAISNFIVQAQANFIRIGAYEDGCLSL
ncbi:hypothetical protein QF028_004993 [Neobacillus sp. B4I6]|jgi:hypothetical protein